MDYENGVTLDQLQEFSAAVAKNAIKEKKSEVMVLQTAIAGLFDHKVVNQFNQILDRISQSIDQLLPSKKPQSKADAMQMSMVELNKLTAALKGRPSLVPAMAR